MKLLFFTPACRIGQSLLMDRAYEGDKMRAAARKLGYNPVVPPKKNRIDPWEYDRILYKRRNEVERFFRRIKRFRRVFTRYDKLDIVFAGFILFAMIFDSLVRTGSNLEALCKARITRGLTISEAAKDAGICLATWAAMERGTTVPRPGTLLKICRVLDIDPKEVIEIGVQGAETE